MHSTGNSTNSESFSCRNFHISHPLCRKLLIRKLVGKSLRFPLAGTLLSLQHSGQAMISRRPLVRRIPFKQRRQKLCKYGSCFGFANVVMHIEQNTLHEDCLARFLYPWLKAQNAEGLIVNGEGSNINEVLFVIILSYNFNQSQAIMSDVS